MFLNMHESDLATQNISFDAKQNVLFCSQAN